jgi:hypothetical protein
MKRTIGVVAAAAAASVVAMAAPAAAAPGAPTCSTTLGISVHGQHVVGDYVTGIGHDALGWPAPGGVVGAAVSANRGAVVPGGPGPGYHFRYGVAPGASFCTASRSPGVHP